MEFADKSTRVRAGQPPAPETGPRAGFDGPSALPAGFMLGEFKIERVLGEGGFGIVYLARDLRLDRAVAIKEFMPTSLAGRQADLRVTVLSSRHQETFDLARRSFINEAKLLAHFDHPALVKVLQFWEDRGTAYMAMPYYQGMTLKQWLKTPGARPDEAFLRGLLNPVIDALEHLHAENCFHRDIAPDNILLLPTGLPLLIDFGAARRVIGDATQALTAILKPGFAPIEQYAESASMKQGSWTDLYALAAVMYYAISGHAPPPSVARIIGDDMAPAVDVGRGRYSPEFLAVIDACLAVRPADRVKTAADVRRRLAAPRPAQGGAVDHLDQTVILPAKAGATLHPIRTESPRPAITPETAAAQGAIAAGVDASGRPTRARKLGWRGGLAGLAGLVLAGAASLWWWQSASPIRAPTPALPPAPQTTHTPEATATPAAVKPPEPVASQVPMPEPAPALRPLPTEAFAAVDLAVAEGEVSRPLSAQSRSVALVIGRDALRLTISSGQAGYLYLFIAEPGATQLRLLFPNRLDQDNGVKANSPLNLPRRGWNARAVEPAGPRRLLAVVADAARDFESAEPLAGGPFDSIALNRDPPASAARRLPYLGAPRCLAAAPDCSERYAAARIDVDYVAPVAAQKPKPAPASAECAQAYQQLSMGMDNPALRARLATLNCGQGARPPAGQDGGRP